MRTKYAENTTVTVSKTKQDIDALLVRYGTHRRAIMEEPGRAVVVFEREDRRVQIEMFLPHPDAKEFKRQRARAGHEVGETDIAKHEQACRSRWRSLALILKAKLEAVESGVTSFETEFLAHIALPQGGTVGSWLKPQLAASLKGGRLPPLLTAGKD